MKSKKTVVIGASPNPARYSNMAVKKLKNHGHEVIAVGLRKGEIDGVGIQTDLPKIEGVDTVTLYVGPEHQSNYYDYIVDLKPRRLIMNPGTYTQEIEKLLAENEIEAVDACTLVMLSANTY